LFGDGDEVADLREAHTRSIPKRYWILAVRARMLIAG
jgi:hypothetical protein